jgi:hypothetical protein
MTTNVPDGDAIAGQIRHHNSTDTDLSDVAQSLTNAHAHRPGLWQQDLDKANTSLHQQGLLMGMDIVGIHGQDIVMKNEYSGDNVLIDSTDINHQHADTTGEKGSTVNGREANLNPDGSGTVIAGRDDKYGWVLASDLLKNQGIDDPTSNQMANYQIELERLNGRPVSEFRRGDEIQVPPSVINDGTTEFSSDRIEDKYKSSVNQVDQQANEAEDALKKFHGWGQGLNFLGTSYITEGDIDTALKRDDLTVADTRGLEFLKENYSALENHDGFHADKAIFNGGIEQWKTAHETELENNRVADYHGTL